jgi:hypothetical protein
LRTEVNNVLTRFATVPGVLKELTVFAIVDNLVRMVMGPSALL